MTEADPGLCPVHGIPDCSPLRNGCSRLTAIQAEPLEVPDYTYRGAAVILTQSMLHSLLEVPEGHLIRKVYAEENLDSVVVLVEGPTLPRVAEGCEPYRVYAKSEAVPVELASGEPGYKLAWKIDWERMSS